jgi:hypothetical protein
MTIIGIALLALLFGPVIYVFVILPLTPRRGYRPPYRQKIDKYGRPVDPGDWTADENREMTWYEADEVARCLWMIPVIFVMLIFRYWPAFLPVLLIGAFFAYIIYAGLFGGGAGWLSILRS